MLSGHVAESVLDKCKVRALKNTLNQSAIYFDQPQTSNAKIIQRISNDSMAMKAVYILFFFNFFIGLGSSFSNYLSKHYHYAYLFSFKFLFFMGN